MTTTEQALAGARRVAKSAAQRSAGLGACPYDARPAATAIQRACAAAWLREYRRWRPLEAIPVDLGDDLLALAHGADSDEAGTTKHAAMQGTLPSVVVAR